ncbi:hypothetical protein MMC08_003079 [Hypocenomyce scalaris]|nr:hypothetical protein [Hypocenomyce scalaris]
MSTHGQFNTKSPTIKRIRKSPNPPSPVFFHHHSPIHVQIAPLNPLFPTVKEATELASTPDSNLHASPLDSNLFEWHFTLSGPPGTPYSSGIYHGRIILPPTYPLRPPSFRFLTPSGRFEVNREICLSISGHHEESWQPAWGVRTALVAIRSFMAGEAGGQVGGLEMGEQGRARLARESRGWRCVGCGGRSNEEILKECDERAEHSKGDRKEETVPDELRLGYRDELEKNEEGEGKEKVLPAAVDPITPTSTSATLGLTPSSSQSSIPAIPPSSESVLLSQPPSRPRPGTTSTATPVTQPTPSIPITTSSSSQPTTTSSSSTATIPTRTIPTRTINVRPPRPPRERRSTEGVPVWVDQAIFGVVLGLVVMAVKKMLYM